jgi:uncharacterized membrane protein YkoI
MAVSKKLVAGGLGIAAVAALGTWAVADLTDDPDEELSTVQLGAVPAAQSPGGGSTGREVLSGTVERVGGDVDDLAIGRVELDFGPDEWVTSTGAVADYDGDGRDEALADELDGLVGRDVELIVSFDDDGDRDDADVHEIDGLPIGIRPQSGDASSDDVARAAEAEVGRGSRAVEVERDDEDDVLIWEVEVIDADGREHTVVVDASGQVLGAGVDD